MKEEEVLFEEKDGGAAWKGAEDRMPPMLQWKLRWKFLGITILAGLVPLLLYASFPLKYFLASLREIEEEVLKEELRETESLLRCERDLLERSTVWIAEFVSRRSGLHGGEKKEWEDLIPWATESLDFGVMLPTGGKTEILFGKDVVAKTEELKKIAGAFFGRRNFEHPVSGLVSLGDRTFLIAAVPVPRRSEKNAGDQWIVSGVDLGRSLIPRLQTMTDHHVAFGVLDVSHLERFGAAARIERESDWVLTIRKPLPGLFHDTQFYIRVDMARGLFSRIEQNQIWYFLIFIGGLYVAGLLGTAWAASIVRKPLARLSETMASVTGPETYSVRAYECRSDEVGELSRSFNRLMERLEEAQKTLERTQQQVSESEKLEAVHAMVITLAHEINNPLTYILGQTDLLLMEDRLTLEDRESLEVIRGMSLRISNVLQRLQDLQKVEMTTYLDWQKMIKWEETSEREVPEVPVPADPKEPT